MLNNAHKTVIYIKCKIYISIQKLSRKPRNLIHGYVLMKRQLEKKSKFVDRDALFDLLFHFLRHLLVQHNCDNELKRVSEW